MRQPLLQTLRPLLRTPRLLCPMLLHCLSWLPASQGSLTLRVGLGGDIFRREFVPYRQAEQSSVTVMCARVALLVCLQSLKEGRHLTVVQSASKHFALRNLPGESESLAFNCSIQWKTISISAQNWIIQIVWKSNIMMLAFTVIIVKWIHYLVCFCEISSFFVNRIVLLFSNEDFHISRS